VHIIKQPKGFKMVSISNWSGAKAVVDYHQKDIDYYVAHDEIGEWFITDDLQNYFSPEKIITKENYKTNFDEILRKRESEIPNKSGKPRTVLDLTFNLPKSVSVVFASADKKTQDSIIKILKEANHETMNFAQDYFQYRKQKDGERKHYKANGISYASFAHLTNRAEEAYIHIHNTVLNQTVDKDGNIVTISETKNLLQNQKLITQVFHQKFFQKLQNEIGLDYEITNLKNDVFEIQGISKEVQEAFSKRREQVLAKAEELKNDPKFMEKYPNISEAKLYEIAATSSRESKKAYDYNELGAILQDQKLTAQEFGITEDYINQLKTLPKTQKAELTADELINKASELATDTESTFTREKLLSHAIKINATQNFKATLEQLETAIQNSNDIVKLADNVYSTKEMIAIEKEILQNTIQSQNTHKAEATAQKANEFISQNYSTMTAGQKNALTHILTTQDQVIGIQGDAGVGKTYMLKALKEFQELSNKENKLIGLSYTGKASSEIKKEADIQSSTLHSFLNTKIKESENNSIYVVDESGTIGSKQLHQLQQRAKQTNSKIVLIGDTKQHQAVQAGAIFQQLQQRGAVKTTLMSQSLRAKTVELQELYQNIKEGETDKALNDLEKRGKFKELGIDKDLSPIVKDYLDDEENTIVIASKNAQRIELNEKIRESKGLGGKTLTVRESLQLKDAEGFFSGSYEEATHIFIQKPMEGFKPGAELKIQSINHEKNTLTVQKENQEVEINLSQNGNKLQAYAIKQKQFTQGERIIFTKNDKKLGFKNGQTAEIEKIEKDQITLKGGKTFNLQNYNYIDYGYAITDYKSQGQTSNKVIALADSTQSSLNSLYVQATRAKFDFKIYTDDKEELRENVQIAQKKTSTLDYTTLEKEINGNVRAREAIKSTNTAERRDTERARDIVRESKKDIDYLNDRTRGREQQLEIARKHRKQLTAYYQHLKKIESLSIRTAVAFKEREEQKLWEQGREIAGDIKKVMDGISATPPKPKWLQMESSNYEKEIKNFQDLFKNCPLHRTVGDTYEGFLGTGIKLPRQYASR